MAIYIVPNPENKVTAFGATIDVRDEVTAFFVMLVVSLKIYLKATNFTKQAVLLLSQCWRLKDGLLNIGVLIIKGLLGKNTSFLT